MDFLIYLAGPITGLDWKAATEWRKDLIQRFKDASTGRINYIGLSPLRGKEYLEHETDIKDGYAEHKMSSSKAITERDLNDVRRSDLVIVNFIGATRVSVGTVLEIGAARVLNVPIILIMDEPVFNQFGNETITLSSGGTTNISYQNFNKNVHDHSMIRESAAIIASNVDEAYEFAIHLLGN